MLRIFWCGALALIIATNGTYFYSHSSGAADRNLVVEEPYRWQIREERTVTQAFFYEGAGLADVDAHRIARTSSELPHSLGDRNISRFESFAENGHKVVVGEGIVLSRRKSTYFRELFDHYYRIENTLTISIPKNSLRENTPVAVAQSVDDGILVFWSRWGDPEPSCFAYAARGSISFERLPTPRNYEFLVDRGDSLRLQQFETIVADLDLHFEIVVDEEYGIQERTDSSQPSTKYCPPFSIRETVEFYRRN